MKLSVIVITYQRPQALRHCLDAIYAQENLPTPYEVLIIDNNGDADIPPPPRADVHLHVERCAENLGVAGGRNRAMNIAKGEYWVFIDDDAIWHKTADIKRLVALLDAYPDCGAVAVKSLHPETHDPILTELPHPDKNYLLQATKPCEVPYFYGVHALRAATVQTVGMYPARFFYAMEEFDLSLRLLDRGYRILYHPDVAIYHYKSSLGRPIQGDDFWYYNALNKSRVAWRLLPYPYPLTVMGIWGVAMLWKTRNPRLVWRMMLTLWRERGQLRTERAPIRRETVRYSRRIGGRLLY